MSGGGRAGGGEAAGAKEGCWAAGAGVGARVAWRVAGMRVTDGRVTGEWIRWGKVAGCSDLGAMSFRGCRLHQVSEVMRNRIYNKVMEHCRSSIGILL